MNWRRLYTHLITPATIVRRYFPATTMAQIEQTIAASEQQHSGEICFAVEAALDFWSLLRDQSARERALEVFAELGVWDTEDNNGVLIYLLLAEHDIEIIADRGIAAKVPQQMWQDVCTHIEESLRQGLFEAGVLQGISDVNQLMAEHFPPRADRAENELPNKPVVL